MTVWPLLTPRTSFGATMLLSSLSVKHTVSLTLASHDMESMWDVMSLSCKDPGSCSGSGDQFVVPLGRKLSSPSFNVTMTLTNKFLPLDFGQPRHKHSLNEKFKGQRQEFSL